MQNDWFESPSENKMLIAFICRFRGGCPETLTHAFGCWTNICGDIGKTLRRKWVNCAKTLNTVFQFEHFGAMFVQNNNNTATVLNLKCPKCTDLWECNLPSKSTSSHFVTRCLGSGKKPVLVHQFEHTHTIFSFLNSFVCWRINHTNICHLFLVSSWRVWFESREWQDSDNRIICWEEKLWVKMTVAHKWQCSSLILVGGLNVPFTPINACQQSSAIFHYFPSMTPLRRLGRWKLRCSQFLQQPACKICYIRKAFSISLISVFFVTEVVIRGSVSGPPSARMAGGSSRDDLAASRPRTPRWIDHCRNVHVHRCA